MDWIQGKKNRTNIKLLYPSLVRNLTCNKTQIYTLKVLTPWWVFKFIEIKV